MENAMINAQTIEALRALTTKLDDLSDRLDNLTLATADDAVVKTVAELFEESSIEELRAAQKAARSAEWEKMTGRQKAVDIATRYVVPAAGLLALGGLAGYTAAGGFAGVGAAEGDNIIPLGAATGK